MTATSDTIQNVIDQHTTVMWFRRDLRLEDNAALYHALKENQNVLPVFIFDTVILNDLEDKQDKRLVFIRQSLLHLQEELTALGSTLLVMHDDPVHFYKSIRPKAVYTNHDYEPYAITRDAAVRAILEEKGVAFKTFKDQVIFERKEVVKDNGEPYTVFTPYSKKWKATLNSFYMKSYPAKKYFDNFKISQSIPIPTLPDIGFEEVDAIFPERVIKTSVIEKYDKQRDYPAIAGTSRLSIHLRFGTVSIRKLVQVAKRRNEVWLNELIWRDFYAMILYHFPHVATKSFRPAYDHIMWRNDVEQFERWCEGKTGYPIVDAGMRELNATGFMHNRVRMIVASFLTKHLLIDWRWGEAYFAKKLLDYDLASNNGGWQWAASSGCDASPYFRVFNPDLQTEKFDRDWKYIRKWVPEVDTENYPAPLVEHKTARDRVLKTYKKALDVNV
jgi:deoxyribodipyrimidine photo-lyase